MRSVRMNRERKTRKIDIKCSEKKKENQIKEKKEKREIFHQYVPMYDCCNTKNNL